MRGRIAVLIPSRGRPELLVHAIKSVEKTSKIADALVYIDDDQAGVYGLAEGPRLRIMCGPRIGPVASANALVAACPEYDLYGLITDDSVITTSGWDEWCTEVIEKLPNRIGVISPHHAHGNYVDMPFVTNKWIELAGWFACPVAYHYVWPIITGLIGEMTAIVHAPQHKFHIEHGYDASANQELRARDYEGFFEFVSRDLPSVVDVVREEMSR